MKYHNRERRTGSRHGSHISLFKMFSRAVLAIVMSLGFGAFWYALAAGIYEKYVTFAESYVTLGNQLNTLRGTYEKGVRQLREGRGNLSSQLEALLQYGVTTTKRLPADMTPILGEEEANEDV